MASGKFIKSKKDILHKSDQYYTVTDQQLRAYFISFADLLSESARDEIVRMYSDPGLASAYRSWRNYNSLNSGFTDKKTLREIVRIPAGHVYEFLKAYFEPLYGQRWLTNKKALRHPLLRQWWIVESI